MELTKTQINKLGNRIRKGKTREGDGKLLDEFRGSFDEAFETASAEIKRVLKPLSGKTTLTDRQTKTGISIKEKLIRLKGRLSEMQDIRGCRVVANDLAICYTVVEKIKKSKLNIVKEDPRNDAIGYRAIHVIVTVKEKPVEIQIRTRLQDIWANICEKYSSKQNDLKYGSRDEKIKSDLKRLSGHIAYIEEIEYVIYKNRPLMKTLIKKHLLSLKFLRAYKTFVKALKEYKKIKKELIKRLRIFQKE